MEQIRQGDVLFERCEAVPASATPVARKNGVLVVAEGEVTGHAHVIADLDAEMFVEKDGTLYLKAPSGATQTHEEHATVTYPAGTYVRRVQREFNAGMVQRTLD